MPIDSSIALGVKPVQIESPLNQMANVYALQNAQQSNQLNQLQLGEAQRKIEDRNRLRSTLGGFAPDMSVDQQVNALARGGFLDEAKALAESAAKVGKEKRESEKALTDIEAAHIKTMREYLPMVKDQPTYDAWRTETAKRLPNYASLFPAQYTPGLNQSLALSADKALENHFVNQENVMVNGVPTSRVLQVPKYGTGAATTLSSTPMGVSPEAQQRIALEKDRVNLEKRRVDIAEKTSAPEYVKPLSVTQQYKLDKLKAADKANAALFESSIDAEIKNIDKLIGSEAKPELHPGLTSAVGPVSSRLPTVNNKAGNAEALIKSLQSKASINSLQTIRGTAGAVGTLTEREWPRLESMKATLQESQSPDQFVTSLVDYRKELQNMKLKAKEALNTDYSAAIGVSVPSANTNVDALLEKYK